MDISVTEFKAHCLDLIRQVEKGGEPVIIKRHGKIATRLEPPKDNEKELKPWKRGRVELTGTVCKFGPGEPVLRDDDFEVLR
jgi:prevent-host-death family protein